MSWIYAFAEQGETRYTKIGVAKDHYHSRFEKTQQCNPRPMEIVAVWSFPDHRSSLAFEKRIKSGAIFSKWKGGGAEWFEIAPQAISLNSIFVAALADCCGTAEAPLPFQGSFCETLNIGTSGIAGVSYRPHLHVIGEDPSSGIYKIALSAYNWPTVVAHYATYNPRPLKIFGRWSFRNEDEGKAKFAALEKELAGQRINPLNWFRGEPERVAELARKYDLLPYGRAPGIDDRVHYTDYRVPVA